MLQITIDESSSTGCDFYFHSPVHEVFLLLVSDVRLRAGDFTKGGLQQCDSQHELSVLEETQDLSEVFGMFVRELSLPDQTDELSNFITLHGADVGREVAVNDPQIIADLRS